MSSEWGNWKTCMYTKTCLNAILLQSPENNQTNLTDLEFA